METLLQQIASATGATDASGAAILTAVSDLQTRLGDQERELKLTQETLSSQGAAVSALRDAAAPRVLSEAAHATLVRELAAAPGGLAFHVVANDPEANAFARRLIAAFEAAGWSVKRQMAFFDPPLRGLRLQIGVSRAPRDHPASTIFSALSAAGLALNGKLDPNLGESDVVLQVGHK